VEADCVYDPGQRDSFRVRRRMPLMTAVMATIAMEGGEIGERKKVRAFVSRFRGSPKSRKAAERLLSAAGQTTPWQGAR